MCECQSSDDSQSALAQLLHHESLADSHPSACQYAELVLRAYVEAGFTIRKEQFFTLAALVHQEREHSAGARSSG